MPPKQKNHVTGQLERQKTVEELPYLRRAACKALSWSGFDYVMGAIIFFNMIVMIVETDRTAMEEDDAPNSFHWTEACGSVILSIFVLEMLVRLFAYRRRFFTDAWNIFDFVIVLTDTAFSLLGLIFGDLFPVSVLRVFRLAKLARVSKVLRVFPELRLLIAGLASSMKAIFWGTILLFLSLLVWSLIAVVFIHPLNKNVDYGDCGRCPRAYSSVMQSCLTFWQQVITGDSWGQATIPLIEKHPMTALYFVPMFLSVGLAIMNLILGVVVSVAQQAKEDIEEEDRQEQTVLQKEGETHLLELCMAMDESGTGTISLEMLHQLFEKPGEFRDALLSANATRDEIDIVWKLLECEEDGSVAYEDLVGAIYKMQGSDTQYMLAYIKHYITLLRKEIKTELKAQHNEDLMLEEKIAEDIHKIEEIEALKFGSWQTLAANQTQQCSNREGNSHAQSNGVAMEKKLSNQSQRDSLQRGSANASRFGRTDFTDEEMDAWLKHVLERIAVLQIDPRDMVRDTDSKMEARVLLVPPPDKDISQRLKTL